MIAKNLRFLPRNPKAPTGQPFLEARYRRLKGKTLRHILLDRFLNQYGYDKGAVTASAIVEDLLCLIEHYYRYTDNSFLKPGQMVWHAVPVDEYPKKGKTIAQTKLKPVVLDMISDADIDDIRTPIHHREIRIKRLERWTTQTYDQRALLTQLDLAVLLNTSTNTVGDYMQEYRDLYKRALPTRGNIQLIGSGQSHKREIVALHLKGYLTPTISQKTNHSRDAVERYIRDFESVKLLATKFDDPDVIARIIRLAPRVVKQYLDLLPLDS